MEHRVQGVHKELTSRRIQKPSCMAAARFPEMSGIGKTKQTCAVQDRGASRIRTRGLPSANSLEAPLATPAGRLL